MSIGGIGGAGGVDAGFPVDETKRTALLEQAKNLTSDHPKLIQQTTLGVPEKALSSSLSQALKKTQEKLFKEHASGRL